MEPLNRFIARHWVQLAVSLVLLTPFVLHTVRALDVPFFQKLEYLAYDARLNLTMPRTTDFRIVIVDVDERSLAIEGHWPWQRDRLGKLIVNLFDHYSTSVVGVDFVFPEEYESVALKVLDEYVRETADSKLASTIEALRPRLSWDAVFGQSLLGRRVILGYYFTHDPDRRRTAGVLPEPMLPAEIATELGLNTVVAYGFGANLAILQRNAHGAGFFENPLNDDDGIFRRMPMLQSYQGALYESLPLAVAGTYLGESLQIGKNNEWLYLGDRGIPVDNATAALVPYRGRQGSFPYISATDVLQKTVEDPAVLDGAIVLLGTTAPGLFDLRNTPVQKIYPGVEVHANVISGILDGSFLQHPEYTVAAEVLGLVIIGLAMAVVMPILSPIWGTLFVVLTLGTTIGINLYAWVGQSMVVPLAPAVLLILTLFLFHMSYGFLVESSGRRELTRRFGQYVPRELVAEMSNDPKGYSLKGERRELTVLFSDVRGFTGISEGLDPQELSDLMSALLTPMTHIIHNQRGTIDKYMGDAIMAFWGAPLRDEDHAAHAVAAALDMQAGLAAIQGQFKARNWPEIRMGIGLNSGLMNVGNMGSEFRMAYTILGDAVNVGARLEGLTKQYGVNIIVSESTAEAAPKYVYRELDRVRVKGRDRPLVIYEPLAHEGAASGATLDERAYYMTCLELYRQQNWDQAEDRFAALINLASEHPLYQLYLERVRYFREHPPGADWDGVYTHQTK